MTGRNDAGFTLVELLVTISILGVISAALTTAVLIALRTTDSTEHRLAESSGAQLLSAYLVSDTQSATTISKSPGASCANGNPLVSFSWTDPATPPVSHTASYACTADGRLVRSHTADAAADQQTLVTDVVGTPIVGCVPSTPTACAPLPAKVSLAVSACTFTQPPCPSSENFDFVVSAGTRSEP